MTMFFLLISASGTLTLAFQVFVHPDCMVMKQGHSRLDVNAKTRQHALEKNACFARISGTTFLQGCAVFLSQKILSGLAVSSSNVSHCETALRSWRTVLTETFLLEPLLSRCFTDSLRVQTTESTQERHWFRLGGWAGRTWDRTLTPKAFSKRLIVLNFCW